MHLHLTPTEIPLVIEALRAKAEHHRLAAAARIIQHDPAGHDTEQATADQLNAIIDRLKE